MTGPRTTALEEDRDFLLRSLEDLEREWEAGDIDEADYVALKDDYTVRAASVLRALAAAPAAAAAAGDDAQRPGAEATTAPPTGGRRQGVEPAAGPPTAGDDVRDPGSGVETAAGPLAGGDDDVRDPGPGVEAAAAAPTGGERQGVEPATAPPIGDDDGRSAAPAGAAQVPGETGGPQARRRDADRSQEAPARRSGWRAVAVGAVLLAFASGAGLLVARSSGQRLPGDAVTGEVAATGPAAGIAGELAEARDLIGKGRTLDAIKLYDRILEKDAGQPEALAYRGWLVRLAGRAAGDQALVDKGMEYIERAVAADPGYPDARFFRAFVNYQDRRNPAAAVPDLRAFLAGDAPEEMVPVVEDLLRRALAEVEAGGPAPVPVPAPSTSVPG